MEIRVYARIIVIELKNLGLLVFPLNEIVGGGKHSRWRNLDRFLSLCLTGPFTGKMGLVKGGGEMGQLVLSWVI